MSDNFIKDIIEDTKSGGISAFEKGYALSKIQDLYSLHLMQPLMSNHLFLPFTGASIRPYSLVHLMNDILINDRTAILEFGSGISTLIIARLIKQLDIEASLISVEHDQKWLDRLKKILKKEQLTDIVKPVLAPLKIGKHSLNSTPWYDLEILQKETLNNTFDMVIVDGPPANDPAFSHSRFPAVPFVIDKLMERCAIYLDDANRDGEKFVLKKWEEEYSMNFRISGTLGYFHRADSYYIEPFV